jgi:hypothetical protein
MGNAPLTSPRAADILDNVRPISALRVESIEEAPIFSSEESDNGFVVVAGCKEILILGAGDTGKSTVFKQASLIAQPHSFTPNLQNLFKETVLKNILEGIKNLAKIVIERNIHLDEEDAIVKVYQLDESSYVNAVQIFLEKDFVQNLIRVWENETVQQIFQDKHALVNDCASEALPYFMNKIAEIRTKDYLPTVQDMLYANRRTTGIVEREFIFKETVVVVKEVGGQRSERKSMFQLYNNNSY